MPAVATRSTGVHVQAVQYRVELDEADVRVATDEEGRGAAAQFLHDMAVVARWPSSDVGHPHPHIAHRKTLVFGEHLPGRGIIDVAEDRAERLVREPALQFVAQWQSTDVAGMPDLVAGGEMFPQTGIQPAVGVAQ
jgi:hypothetical protein